MAYENIQIEQDNFCMGPQAGTFCTLDTSNVTSLLRVKNASGGFISDYTLSSNIINDIVGLEYVGPKNISGMLDGLVFFTLEKVSSVICILKRWEVDTSFSNLDLKQQTIFTDVGLYHFDALGMAIEHYEIEFSAHIGSYQNYVDVSDTSFLQSGMQLFLGPSTDTDNLGVSENVRINYISGDRVYLTSFLNYQYIEGDSITFYNNAYIFSGLGLGTDTTKGTLFTINSTTGSITNVTTDGVYQRVKAGRWCSISQSVAAVCDMNMLFIRPYDFYLNWRSLFLNNNKAGKIETFTIYDVVFDNYSVYKLSKNIVKRDDDGAWSEYVWDDYNYIEDSLLPYTNSINIYTDDAFMISNNDTTELTVQVRDQFGVGLRDVPVNLYKDGDTGAEFDPLNGQGVTDINGKVIIGYESGTTYEGHTEITGKASGGSTFTGSEYVWTANNIISEVTFDPLDILIHYPIDPVEFDTHIIKQLRQTFMVYQSTPDDGWFWGVPRILILPKTWFTSIAGEWVDESPFSDDVEVYLPDLVNIGDRDGPNHIKNWGGFESKFPHEEGWQDGPLIMPSRVIQVSDFSSEQQARQLSDYFKLFRDDAGFPPFSNVQQKLEIDSDLQASQINLSKHTHWVDGVAYDTLWTDVNIDQFVFVEDAIPKFWSEKNPIETDIWIRLRPFAFSLDGTTLTFKVREVSQFGDTGYVDVTNDVSLTYFDAGGGILGLELFYEPANNFHYNGIVYVHIEIYDTTLTPNYIYVNYWFKLIPDYRVPYLENQNPAPEQTNVSVDTTIYFEVKDKGVGVDIDTLDITLNSRAIYPQSITRVSAAHYIVECTLSDELYFNKEYNVSVKVMDLSINQNYMNSHYRFFTVESDSIILEEIEPQACRWGFPLYNNVSFLALAAGSGVDGDSLRLQVHNYDVTDMSEIIPIVYRIS
jgi:hypothetical protein